MALTASTRLQIRYPDLAQAADLANLLQIIATDAELTVAGFKQGAHSLRPPANAANEGIFYWETDTLQLFYCDGASWQNIGPADNSIGSTKLGPLTINHQTGASTYTLVLADQAKIIERENALANSITIPLHSSVAFPIGVWIDIIQTGAGQVTVLAASGVTLRSNPGPKLLGQWAAAQLYQRAVDEWVLFGNLTT